MDSSTYYKVVIKYLAWAVIIGFALFILSALTVEEPANITGSLLFILATILVQVAAFIYPIAILWYAVKEGNYSFLKNALHYVALPLAVLFWVTAFAGSI